MLEKDGFGRRQKIEDNPRTCAVQRHHIPASKVYKKSQFVQKEKKATNKVDLYASPSACNKTYVGQVGGGWYGLKVPR